MIDSQGSELPPDCLVYGRRMRSAGGLVIACLAVLAGGEVEAQKPGQVIELTPVGTPELREELFDSIIEMTRRREAWSPFKEEHMGYDPLTEMEALRSKIVNATTEEDLYYGLALLSNARRDSHLYLTPVPDGLKGPSFLRFMLRFRFFLITVTCMPQVSLCRA